jgi:hypothetical protein
VRRGRRVHGDVRVVRAGGSGGTCPKGEGHVPGRVDARVSEGLDVDSSVPPVRERGSGCASERGRRKQRRQAAPNYQREGERARGWLGWIGPTWAEIGFPFCSEFLIPFLFIFSMEFKSNQTTIQVQIFQTCASTKNKV